MSHSRLRGSISKTGSVSRSSSSSLSKKLSGGVRSPGIAQRTASDSTARQRVQEKLSEALFNESEEFSSKEEANDIAKKIESEMYSKYGGCTQEYKDKYRTLNFNLKDELNSNLRERIFSLELSAKELMEMGSEELANENKKEVRKKIIEEKIREAQPFNAQTASTDQFRCGKCRQRECTYYQLQTRSADEPMTTFVTCVKCGNRWKC